MLAPPNRGSSFARTLKKSKVFEWITGDSGNQLGSSWDELEKKLATPANFGIVAGSTRDGRGTNPLILGDDDVVVGVNETRLPGAADFLVVPSIHTTIMNHDKVHRATHTFLKQGHFVSAEARKPIQPSADD